MALELTSGEIIGIDYLKKRSKVFREGEVKDFPRKSLGSWDLLHRILKNALDK